MNPPPKVPLSNLIDLFGEQFIKYVTNVQPDDEFPQELTTPQEEAIGSLSAYVFDAMEEGLFPREFLFFASHEFNFWNKDTGTTRAHSFRIDCGGSVEPIAASNDGLVQALMQISSDVWPALLMTHQGLGHPPVHELASLSTTIRHPTLLEACKAILADPELTLLFPDAVSIRDSSTLDERVLSISSDILLSNGASASTQLVSVPGLMIMCAALEASNTSGAITYDSLAKALPQTVSLYRSLATGEIVDFPAVIGISGPRIADDSYYGFGEDGGLRKPYRLESELLLADSNDVTSVIQTSVPIRILQLSRFEQDPHHSGDEAETKHPSLSELAQTHRSALIDRIDRIRLSLVLTSPEAQRSVSIVSIFSFNPLHTGGALNGGEIRMNGIDFRLDSRVGARTVVMHKSISAFQSGRNSLLIAQRRILRATSTRQNPDDALIDAVMVWENALGARSETTFRVTAAIAKLLEPDSGEKRLALQKELKTIYGMRSKLVHGSKDYSPSDLYPHRARAIEIAISVLRNLYERRTDLLEIDSASRGTRLLLE